MVFGRGEEAIEAVQRQHFDIALVDLYMTPVSGMDVLRAVKDAQNVTEVIVMTAYGSVASAVEAMRLGAFDYLQKPFTEEELLAALERALERRRLRCAPTPCPP